MVIHLTKYQNALKYSINFNPYKILKKCHLSSNNKDSLHRTLLQERLLQSWQNFEQMIIILQISNILQYFQRDTQKSIKNRENFLLKTALEQHLDSSLSLLPFSELLSNQVLSSEFWPKPDREITLKISSLCISFTTTCIFINL